MLNRKHIILPMLTVWIAGACGNLTAPEFFGAATPESQRMDGNVLDSAFQYAFAPGNNTAAVIAVRNGQIVMERYSDGYVASDLVTSWSVAKSFTSVLMGLAINDGYVSGLQEPASYYFESWKSDSRKSLITIDHLMTLRTALARVVARDLYFSPDQLSYSRDRDFVGDEIPGVRLYPYSNADVMLASSIIEKATQEPLQVYLDEKIGTRIGFKSEWWTDSLSQAMGYCCLDATARDFARFGVLLAHEGKWLNDQVVPVEWIRQTTAPALSGTYSYYWWPATWDDPSSRNAGFAAIGRDRQVIGIFPELDLVVVRFSEYERVGDGTAVRTGDNGHITTAPENFDIYTFLAMARNSVVDDR